MTDALDAAIDSVETTTKVDPLDSAIDQAEGAPARMALVSPLDPDPVATKQVEDDRNQKVATLQDAIDRGLKSTDDEAGINEVATITGADTATVRQAFPEFKHAAAMSKFDARKLHDNYPDLANLILENPHLVKPITQDEKVGAYVRANARYREWERQNPIAAQAAHFYSAALTFGASGRMPDVATPAFPIVAALGQLPELETKQVTYENKKDAGFFEMVGSELSRGMKAQYISALEFKAIFDESDADLAEEIDRKTNADWRNAPSPNAAAARAKANALRSEIVDRQNHIAAPVDYDQNWASQLLLDAIPGATSQVGNLAGMGIGALVGGGIGAALGALTKSPGAVGEFGAVGVKAGAFVGTFVSSFVPEAGNAHQDYRRLKLDDGSTMDPTLAKIGALGYGAGSAFLETIETLGPGIASLGPLGKRLSFLKTTEGSLDFAKSGFGRKAWEASKGVFWEGETEKAQAWLQAIVPWVLNAGDQTFDVEKAIREGEASEWGGWLGAIGIQGGQSVASHAFLGTVGMVNHKIETERALAGQAQVAKLMELSKSPVARTSTKALAKMVQSQAEAAGRPVREVWANPVRIIEVAQDKGITPSQLATELMGEDGPSRLRRALESWKDEDGGRASLPFTVEETLGKVGNHPASQLLLDDMTAASGALTLKEMTEAPKYDDSNTKTRTKEILEEMQRDGYAPATPVEAKMVTAIEEGLKLAKKFTPEKVEATVAAARAVAETMSARMGTPHEQTFARYIVTLEDAKSKGLEAAPVDVAAKGKGKAGASSKLITTAYQAMDPSAQAKTYFIDHQTGLLNDRGDAQKPLDPARPMTALFSVPLKVINDHLKSGDKVLKILSSVIQRHVPDAAKHGGDIKADVVDQMQADTIAAEMEKALDPERRIKVTATVAHRGDMKALGKAHKANKAGRYERKEIGHRLAAPLAFMPEAMPLVDWEKTNKPEAGLALNSPEVKAMLAEAAGKMKPLADEWSKAAMPGQVSLTEAHESHFADLDPKEAERIIHYEGNGMMTGQGFEAAQRLNPKKFTASADMRGIWDMNEAFGEKATDAILDLFSGILWKRYGKDLDLAHLHGDEFAAQHDDEGVLRQAMEHLQKLTEGLLLMDESKDGDFVIQDGVQFAFEIGGSYADADANLQSAKDRQRPRGRELSSRQDFPGRVRSLFGERAGRIPIAVRVLSEQAVGRDRNRRPSNARLALIREIIRLDNNPVEIARALKDTSSPLAEHLADLKKLEATAKLTGPPATFGRGNSVMASSMWNAWTSVLEAGSVTDELPSEKQDSQFKRFKAGQGERPGRYPGGLFQGLDDDFPGEPPISGGFEALWRLTRGSLMWADIGPAVERLREIPGFEGLRLPQEVIERMAADMDFNPNDPNILYSRDTSIERGYVQIAKNSLKTAFKIFVTEHADISTPLHELAHTYMEMLADIAETPNAPESFKRDFALVLAEYGAESRGALTEANKEAFAEGFEKYLLEGKAPSIGLAGIFQSLRAWLLEVYKGIRGLNVKLSDEMRGVFDRMLATDTEIEEMQRAMGRDGPPDLRAQREVAKMQRGALAPEWRKAVEAGRVEAEVEYDRRPDFQAMRLLTKGEAVDATGAVVEALSGGDVGKLDRKAVLKDIAITSALGKKLRPRLAKKGGLSPASVAAQFGYADAREMYRALDTLPDRETTVAPRAQAIAAQNHPELAIDQARVTKIIGDTLHEGEPLEIVRELEKLVGGKENTQALRDAAQQLAAQQVVGRISLTHISNRERLMAEQSMMWAGKGNIGAAIEAKRKQLLAHYFYHEMALLRDERDAFTELVDDLQTVRRRQVFGKAGGAYGDVTETVLESIGAKESVAASDRKGLADVAADLALDELAAVDLARLEKLTNGTGWKSMTGDDMRFLRDALGQFWTAAQDRVGVIVDGKREAINILGAKMYGDSSLGPSKGNLPMQGEKPGRGMQSERSLMQSVSASLAKPLELFRELGDTAMTVFWNGYLDARKAEDDLARDVLGYLEKHWLPDNLKDTLHEELTDLDGVPWPKTSLRQGPMTRSHMLLVALNMFNESNRERLLGGYGWAAEVSDPSMSDDERSATEAAPVLSWLERNMTAKEWDFVESIWKLFDGKLRGRMVEVFKDINGIEPRLIKATPHTLANGRVISGGYFPAKYDPKTSALGARVEGEASTNLYKDGRATVSKAFTKERAAHYSDVVSLDWGVVPGHVASVIHYVAFERYIRDANRVLKNEMAQKAVTLRLGVEYAPALESWLRAVASSSADAVPRELHGLHGLYGYARSAAVVSAIGFSVPVAAGDLFNPFVALAAGNIKAKHLAVAALKTIPIATYGKTRKQALALSAELRHRTENLSKNIRWLLDRARGEGRISKLQDGAITAAFYMMEVTDRIMSTVIWQAKYSEGLVSGMQESEAVRQADVTVQESLPSHDPAEMASITRDKRGMAALIMFYGWFNTVYNMNRKIIDQVQVAYHEEGGLSGTLSAAGAAGKMLGIFLVGNVVAELFSARGPEDDEEVAEWLIRKMLAAPFTTLPLVGPIGEELVNQAVSGKHRPFSVRASPGASVVEKLAKAITKALDDGKDVDERVLAGLEAAGVITKTPIGTAQFKRMAGYVVGEEGLSEDIARGGIAGVAGAVEGVLYGSREGKAATPLSILTRE